MQSPTTVPVLPAVAESITGDRARIAKRSNAVKFAKTKLEPLLADLGADTQPIAETMTLWARRHALAEQAKSIAVSATSTYESEIEALALGTGSLDAAVSAATDTAAARLDGTAAKQALTDAADRATALAFKALRANRAAIFAAVNDALTVKLTQAAEALTRIPEGVLTADDAVQASADVAADWATLAAASTLWRRSVDVVGGLDGHLGASPVGRSSLRLYRQFAHPEYLTRSIVRLPDPLRVAAAVKVGAQPGAFDVETAGENFARVNMVITEGRLPGDSAIRRIDGRDDHLRPSTEL